MEDLEDLNLKEWLSSLNSDFFKHLSEFEKKVIDYLTKLETRLAKLENPDNQNPNPATRYSKLCSTVLRSDTIWKIVLHLITRTSSAFFLISEQPRIFMPNIS